MQLRHAARTDVGATRDHNEDNFGVEAGSERAAAGALFVVCDGIGGFASGEVASELAVQTIIDRFYADPRSDRAAALEAAFHAANEAVFRQGGGKMGTTGVAAVFHDDALVVANVGDCRAYLIRNHQAQQITRDHSFVAEQVAAGVMTEEQAQASSYRHVITRGIGHRPEVEVDIFRLPLLRDDIVVLCSDGLHGQVQPHEIALAVTKAPLDQACRGLIRLANERGGPDNITVVAVKVEELTFGQDAPRRGDATATVPMARFEETPRATARLDAASRTAKLANAPAFADRRSGIDRRSGVDRRRTTLATPPESERRQGERRQLQADARPAAPSAPASRSGVRSFVLWAVALLLLATLIFGAYYLGVFGDAFGPAPTAAPLTPPTLTPPGNQPTQPLPTLVPTMITTPTP